MEQIIIQPDYLDAVKYAVETHSLCITGMGLVSGKKFAKAIRKFYNQDNPMNSEAAYLAEVYIRNIEVLDSGTVRWQIS